MQIAFLEPYFGGSHRAVLEGWSASTRHKLVCLTLPPRHWKWRMHAGSYQLAVKVNQRFEHSAPDLIVASSLLDAASVRGYLLPHLRAVPLAVYFHENQFSYPNQSDDGRDLHYHYINVASALAADVLWFNSQWNRDSFLDGLEVYLAKMPDKITSAETLAAKASVLHPGVESFQASARRAEGPLRILWNHRWEHDKRPDRFFEALCQLESEEFQLVLCGETFGAKPSVADDITRKFSHKVVHRGFVEERHDYEEIVMSADVVLSTADHEFYGLSVAEAMANGCHALLPDRLSYPELVLPDDRPQALYQTQEDMIERLRIYCRDPSLLRRDARPKRDDLLWSSKVSKWDDCAEAMRQ